MAYEFLQRLYRCDACDEELADVHERWRQLIWSGEWERYRDNLLDAFSKRSDPFPRTDRNGVSVADQTLDAFLDELRQIYQKYGLCIDTVESAEMVITPLTEDHLFELVTALDGRKSPLPALATRQVAGMLRKKDVATKAHLRTH